MPCCTIPSPAARSTLGRCCALVQRERRVARRASAPLSARIERAQEISAFRGEYRYYEAEAGDVDMYLAFGPTVLQAAQRLTNRACHDNVVPS